MIKVFTVVLNWNRKQDTLDCIASLKKLDTKNIDHEIVVVDNNSSDGTLDAIKDKSIIKIKNDSNLGYAEGNNVGLRYAIEHKADFVMVLNNDTILHKNLLQEFVSSSHRYPDAAVFSPKIYFAKGFEFHKKRYKKSQLGKVIWYAGGMIDFDNVYGYHLGVDKVDKGQFDKEKEINFATGTCMFIRVNSLLDDELFNPLYYLYLEDMEFSMKLTKRGFKIMYIPSAILWHKVSQSSAIGAQLNDYFIARNRMMFGMSFAPVRAKAALVRQSYMLLLKGRKWERRGILDFYLGRFEKGSWK